MKFSEAIHKIESRCADLGLRDGEGQLLSGTMAWATVLKYGRERADMLLAGATAMKPAEFCDSALLLVDEFDRFRLSVRLARVLERGAAHQQIEEKDHGTPTPEGN
jgi:hypothetical protein